MTADDLPQVRELAAQLGYEIEPSRLGDAFARVSRSPDHHLLVATEGPRVVGWLHALGTELLYYDRYVEIAALVVDEAARRSGVGSALLQAAEAWGRARGDTEIRVRSRVSRDGAHRFYVRLGYEKEKTQYTFARRLD